MRDDIMRALDSLVGLRLWDSGRAVEMKKFAFGEERTLEGPRTPTVAGEWELHLMCGWRLVGRDGLLVGSTDIRILADEDHELPWDEKDANICDLRCQQIFSTETFRVDSVEVGELAGTTIHATNGVDLKIWSNSWNAELWRLFVPGTSSPHFVVETIDGRLKASWE